MSLAEELPRLLARHEGFAPGKTSAQGEFTSPEQVKGPGLPQKAVPFVGRQRPTPADSKKATGPCFCRETGVAGPHAGHHLAAGGRHGAAGGAGPRQSGGDRGTGRPSGGGQGVPGAAGAGIPALPPHRAAADLSPLSGSGAAAEGDGDLCCWDR